ncbi:type II toxin-antitoxin system VapB family antitoxin [Kutzneria chonburiensis]|uniref:Type II toxin-antitoxin system VapB family antitoxin n=1 Tax=Kutzneria chonburiensis TaxID=1483604 RepID=A0ABV6N741_9PSEU|nr:type II toxin-antitoxin system VapB family antitoxin [Kutzneria chonburiensis]
MSVTQVDLDDEALNEAMRLLGTKTKKETINMALREVVQRQRRMEAFDQLLEMGQRGDFDQAAEAHAAAKKAWKQAWGMEVEA